MSLNACAALVQRADPARFRATMTAPVPARRVLFPIYAFNVEVARAPWVTEEPMIAEMRLQWWRDALEEIAAGGPARKHEVVDALAQVLDPEGAKLLDGLVAARRWDIYKDPFEDTAHFDSYIDATAGHLMWTAARLLGAAPEQIVRDFAAGSGIANWFQAIPDLEERGRKPLVDGSADGVKALARQGLDRLKAATAARRRMPADAAPALLAGYAARPTLQRVARRPAIVSEGRTVPHPMRDQLRFLHVALRGWWV
ncbi:squalene/phytoene synthase family protein [Yoonia sp. BS5-3]|uniref:Squalene/phytoene synthase family protein n=1 Tax=Yoonia phaeophyticola TaxID=3137369 RepID=A0ABZ2V2N3_9RHOB